MPPNENDADAVVCAKPAPNENDGLGFTGGACGGVATAAIAGVPDGFGVSFVDLTIGDEIGVDEGAYDCCCCCC